MSAMMRGNVRMALSGIRGAKWRSVLTMLGVIVGIVAVVLAVGIGKGVERQVSGTLEHYGKDLLIIRPGKVNGNDMISTHNTDALFGQNAATSLTTKDVDVIKKTPGIQKMAPLGVVSGLPKADGHSEQSVFVVSTSRDLGDIVKQSMYEGGFWEDSEANENVAVIGKKVASKLFGEPVPLGRRFEFRGQSFIVRGVFDQWVNVPFSPTANFNDAIFIPYQTAARITGNNSGLYTVLVKTGSDKTVPQVSSAIGERLAKAHGGQRDFSILDSKSGSVASADVVHVLSVWVWAVAGISLFIGGVGIMNIMLLSVTERMHEIGVRKAIGATGRQIMWQFLLEAAILSLAGCVIGVVLSFAGIGLMYAYTNLKPVICWEAIAIATGVSLAIGIVFGTAPAIKAASKDPIQALRHE